MKIKFLATTLGSLALSVALTGSAHAAMIAGWDFSQYFATGELSVDGAEYTNVLTANYSNLDPTFGAGSGSATFGQLYMNGSFGSTNVDPASAASQVTPTSLSLASNINAPVTGPGLVPFDSFTVLQDEGQLYANELSLQIRSAVSFVFAAYTTSIPELGSDWSVSFGGQTDSGSSTIDIAFSTDGVSYTPAGSRTLTAIDTLFTLNLGALPSDAAFVRFSVNPTGANTRIDNVAISGSIVPPVPEPATVVLLGATLAAFAALRRRSV